MGFFDTFRTLGWGTGPIAGGVISDVAGMGMAFVAGSGILFVSVVAIHLTVPDIRVGDDGTAPAPAPGSDEPVTAPVAGGATGSEAGQPDPAVVQAGQRDASYGHATVLGLFSSWTQATSLLGLSLSIVTLMMGFSAMVAMENPILERIGGTLAGFGIIFAITTLVRLVLQFPVGVASDRYGRKLFIVWGLVANAPIVALMGYASTLWEFTLLRGLQGIALAGVIAPAFALAADIVDERHAAQQMGVVSASFSVGFVVGPILAGALAFLGFAVPFVVAGVLTVVGAIGVWLMVDEPDA